MSDELIRKSDVLKWVCDSDLDLAARKAIASAIRTLPSVTVAVKPLVWEPSAINKPWHSAKAPWGWYYAQWDDETQAWFASLEMGEVEAPIILSPSDVPSIQAAKAAAQADYEARILAALEPVASDPLSDPRVKALLDTLSFVANIDTVDWLEVTDARQMARDALRQFGGEA